MIISEAGGELTTIWQETTAIGFQGDQLDSEGQTRHRDTQLPGTSDLQPAECEAVGTSRGPWGLPRVSH